MPARKTIKKKRKILIKKIFFLFLLAFILFMFWVVFGAWRTNSDIVEQRQIQNQKLEQYEQRIDYLNRNFNFLQTKQGMEDELIKTLPVKKTGEEVIILVEQEEEEGDSNLRTSEQEENGHWWWPF